MNGDQSINPAFISALCQVKIIIIAPEYTWVTGMRQNKRISEHLVGEDLFIRNIGMRRTGVVILNEGDCLKWPDQQSITPVCELFQAELFVETEAVKFLSQYKVKSGNRIVREIVHLVEPALNGLIRVIIPELSDTKRLKIFFISRRILVHIFLD